MRREESMDPGFAKNPCLAPLPLLSTVCSIFSQYVCSVHCAVSTMTTRPARGRNQWMLMRSNAHSQRTNPKARLRKRQLRRRARAWQCRGATPTPHCFLQRILSDLCARRRRMAPREMSKKRREWRTARILLPQGVLQADVMMTVSQLRGNGTNHGRHQSRAPTMKTPQVLSLPTSEPC